MSLPKSYQNKRRFQKRKTIKDILGANQSNIKITKRAKNDYLRPDLDKSDNTNYRSPQNRMHKNISKLDKSCNNAINKSFKICDDRLPELNLNQDKIKGKRKINVQLNEISAHNLWSLTDTQIEYWSTDKGKTSYNKENKDRFRILYHECSDTSENKGINSVKRKLLS